MKYIHIRKIEEPDTNANCIGLWVMNQGAGTIEPDLSVNDNDCTLDDSSMWEYSRQGYQYCIKCNGTQKATITHNTNLNLSANDFRLHCSFKYTSTTTDAYLMKKIDTSTGGWYIKLQTDKKIEAYLRGKDNGNNQYVSIVGATPCDTNWHEIDVIFRQNGTSELYLDGIKDGEGATAISYSIDNTEDIIIGETFDGKIDNIGIYKEVLTATEVLELYGDITDYVRAVEIDRDIGHHLQVASFEYHHLAVPEITEESLIEIWGGDTARENLLYIGFVVKIDKHYIHKYTASMNDLLYLLTKKYITEEYRSDGATSGKLTEIVRDIIDNSGTFLSSDGIQTNNEAIVEKYWCNRRMIYDVINEIAGILGWQFYVDFKGVVHLEPKGYIDNSRTIEVGINAVKNVKNESETKNYFNDLTVVASPQEFQRYETKTGDGTTKEFQLDYTPVSSVRVTVNDVEKKGGGFGTTTDEDFRVEREMNVRKIVFNVAPASGASIKIWYDGSRPLITQGNNYTEVERTYGVTREEVVINEGLKTSDDVNLYYIEKLSSDSTPFNSGELSVYKGYIYSAGEVVTLIDSIQDINTTIVIQNVKITYPGLIDILKYGKKLIKNEDNENAIQERLRTLERKNQGKEEFLTKLLAFSYTATISADITTKIETRTVGNAFMFNVSQYDIDALENGMGTSWVEA